MATKQRLIEVLTTAMEKPDIANALIQRVINELKKEWVGLTDGDVNYCVDAIYKGFDMKPKNEIEIEYFERVIKFVEAKLKEKNT